MPITAGIHDPQSFVAHQSSGHTWVAIDEASVFVRTPAQCDEAIKAFITAKQLLLGDNIPPALVEDLAQAEADPANPYGGAAKHGEFTAASAAEGVGVHDFYGEHGHCTGCVGITTNWIVPATGDDRLCDECRERISKDAPAGHLPQHKGGHPECTLCDEPGHHLHAIEVPTRGEL